MQPTQLDRVVIENLLSRFSPMKSEEGVDPYTYLMTKMDFRVCTNINLFGELIKKEFPVYSSERWRKCIGSMVSGVVLDIWGAYKGDMDSYVVHIPSKTIVYQTCSISSAYQLVSRLFAFLPELNESSLHTKTIRQKISMVIRSFKPIKAGTIYFASGLHQPSEVKAFATLGIPPGTAASVYLSKTGKHRYMRQPLKRSIVIDRVYRELPVFVDSGAYSIGVAQRKFDQGKSKIKPTPLDWKKVFEIYEYLSIGYIEREGWYAYDEKKFYPIYFVAPDVIGDPISTLRLIEQYADEIKKLCTYTSNYIIVALHHSPQMTMIEFDRHVSQIIGDRWVRGYPMVKGVTQIDDFIDHLVEIQPKRLHLLGLGYLGDNYRPFMEAILCHVPNSFVSMDS